MRDHVTPVYPLASLNDESFVLHCQSDSVKTLLVVSRQVLDLYFGSTKTYDRD